MATDGHFKLIYYPCGNVSQLFDIVQDPGEHHDLIGHADYAQVQAQLTAYLISHLHDGDLEWLKNGQLCGFEAGKYAVAPDYSLYNHRGYHWPTPGGYVNTGKN